MTGFDGLHLPASLLSRLQRLGFVTPTSIQSGAIPVALEGRDVVGIAQTGTGKTLAFGLPTLANLKEGEVGLVVAPTRELAIQIEETLVKLGARTALLIGGAPMGRQVTQLRARPQVVVATPGRLLDHMGQRTIDLRRASIVVLDEADRMLDMGFAPSIRQILAATPSDRQTMLFSATMPREIEEMASRYLKNPARIEIARPGTPAEDVQQELHIVQHEMKPTLLRGLLQEHTGTVLVFA
ncbi:MAG TPA: DEAD/DEAH box helicase, partial [Fimbriimonadaceae bacterium]|nr:DEAD/DEAH box helicase [Fimbriimonadaceae bacterium]